MRTLAIILAIVGVSSAATFVAMDDKDLEKVMMEQMYARDPSHPFMSVGAMMAARQQKEQDPEPLAEPAGEREARAAEDTYGGEPEADAPSSRQPFNMFGNGMMAMMFPEMMFTQNGAAAPQKQSDGNGHASNGNGQGATPYAAGQPAVNGHHANGNGHKRPTNGNGHSRPTNGNGHGNGKRGGSAAAASAASFNRGSSSFSSSQAQAFSGSF